MEFVPLWSHCQTKCKSVILLRSVRMDGRRCADTAESIGLWNKTDARPLGEMRFYAFSEYERENDFGSHYFPTPLFSPPPPQVLTPFNNVQLLTDTKTALHCARAILLCSSTGFISDSWNRRGFCCLSFIFMAYSKRSLLYSIISM